MRQPSCLAAALAALSVGCNDRPAKADLAGSAAPSANLVSGSRAADTAAAYCFEFLEQRDEREASAGGNPTDPHHVVAAWELDGGSGQSVVMTAVSRDGGRTWGARQTPIRGRCGKVSARGVARIGQPSVAIGPDGRVYLGAVPEYWDRPGHHSGLEVATSPDGGTSWNGAVVVAASEDEARSYSRPAVAADPGRAGTAYLVGAESRHGGFKTFRATPGLALDVAESAGRVVFSATTDGGGTWSAPRPISPERPGRWVASPRIVTDPRGGALHLFYFERDPVHDGNAIELISSVDQGRSWTEPTIVSQLAPYRSAVRVEGTNATIEIAADMVAPGIDVRAGTLYVSYVAGRAGAGTAAQVWLRSSIDGGKTWTGAIRVNGDTAATAGAPSLAVGPDGTVSVSYLDVADSATRSYAVLPASIRRRTFRPDGNALAAGPDALLDQFNLAATLGAGSRIGNTSAELPIGDGFRTVYTRSNCEPYSIVCLGSPDSGFKPDRMSVHAK